MLKRGPLAGAEREARPPLSLTSEEPVVPVVAYFIQVHLGSYCVYLSISTVTSVSRCLMYLFSLQEPGLQMICVTVAGS